jgi:hypothetical protein
MKKKMLLNRLNMKYLNYVTLMFHLVIRMEKKTRKRKKAEMKAYIGDGIPKASNSHIGIS